MPLFDYTGQTQSGQAFYGTLEAASQQAAEDQLAKMGVRTTSLRPARRTGYVAPLSLDDFLFFNEQIAAMTTAGVPLQEGLRQLAADVGSRKLKTVILELVQELEAGTPLEAALTKLRHRFPTQYAGVIQAGLRSGDLGGTLHALATHLRLKSDLRRALIEAGIYPLVILVFAFGIISLLMHLVIPHFAGIMDDFGVRSLPGLTTLLFSIARAWPLVELGALILVLVVIGIIAILNMPGMSGVREALIRRLPIVSKVYWSSVQARFAHTSALAAFTGTPLPDLITAASAASGSFALQKSARRIADRLTAGASLEEAAKSERAVPALWTCVVSVTSARGELPAALEELARTYELRAREWSGVIRAIWGPVLILLLGVTLGFCILGLLLPMVNLIQGLTS